VTNSGSSAFQLWEHVSTTVDRALRDFEHFIEREDVQPLAAAAGVKWEGRIHCAGGIVIEVFELQETGTVRGRPAVRTVSYSFQVCVPTRAVAELFRYDNSHRYPGHPSKHHKHETDEHGGESVSPTDGPPTLGDVLREAWQLALARGLI
jgi:hypothetical protein